MFFVIFIIVFVPMYSFGVNYIFEKEYLDNNVTISRVFNLFQVLKVIPKTKNHLIILNGLHGAKRLGLDFWNVPTKVNIPVEMLISPRAGFLIRQLFHRTNMDYSILVKDINGCRHIKILKRLLFSRCVQLYLRETRKPTIRLNVYHPFYEINRNLYDLSQSYPHIANTYVIGISYEKRDLTVLKLLEGYHTNSLIKALIDGIDWYIMPVANPDGYHFTWTKDRMWRKTRSGRGLCKGVDLNRNWDFHWNENGSSSDTCSPIYAGTKAFSESESYSMSQFIYAMRNKMKIYLSLHAFSQYWLLPWSYSTDKPHDHDEIYNFTKIALDELNSVHGTEYEIGTSAECLYISSGNAKDWAKGVAGIKYSATVELRDKVKGSYGFLMPEKDIIPTANETWAAIRTLAGLVLNGSID